jgi:hypothetical protein
MFGTAGIIHAIRPGSVYIDLSTNSPTLVRRIHQVLKQKGVDMLDAPVSGGAGGAKAANLAIMVGGDEAVFRRVAPVLEIIGAKDQITHIGAIGAGNIAKDLLSVADNLRRALDSAPAAPDEATKNLLAGVAATERELMAAFERNGIRRVEPKLGDRFDPNQHEAMFEVPNTGHAAGSIVQVLQPGYMIQDRLLRPAMVGVAKAEPGAAEPRRFDEVV